MEFQQIKFSQTGGVGVITLNAPKTLNALTRAMLREFDAALDICTAPDSTVRCILLTGEGRGFSAGMNLTDIDGSKKRSPDLGKVLDEYFTPLLIRLRDLEVPLVVGLNGVTAGVTMAIALMGDIILAARSAYFLQPFTNLGLIPDGGATYLLPRFVGKARAFELSLLGERLSSDKALEWGLINSVHDDGELYDAALAMAGRLAAGPTRAYALTRKAFWEGLDNSFVEQLQLERALQRTAGLTEDAGDATRAFLEKRPAKFVGR